MLRRVPVFIVLVYALVALVGLLLGVRGVAAGVLLAPLVFFVPGYGICFAMEPAERLDAEGVLFAVAVSLAATVVSGLVLNAVGLSTTTWATFLLAITVGTTAIGGLRLGKTSEADRRSRPSWGDRVRRARGIGHATVLVLFAMACVLAAIVVTLRAARHAYATPLTTLSSVEAGQDSHQVTVENLSPRTEHYQLQLRATRGVETFLVSLGPAQTWRHLFVDHFGAETATLIGSSGRPISHIDWTS